MSVTNISQPLVFSLNYSPSCTDKIILPQIYKIRYKFFLEIFKIMKKSFLYVFVEG